MKYDIHCHADRLEEREIEEAIGRGIVIGAVAMDILGVEKILQMKKRYPENIEVFLGIHPEVDTCEEEIEKMLGLIDENHDILAGVGEVGIPFFYLEDKTPEEKRDIKEKGASIMERFVEKAAKYDLPLNLHVVEDDLDLALPILRRYGVEGALFHWYEGSEEQLKKIAGEGHYISVSPWIFVEEHYMEFAKMIPLEILLLESDGPCEYNGRVGAPAMIDEVAKTLAENHGMKVSELMDIVEKNTLRYLRR